MPGWSEAARQEQVLGHNHLDPLHQEGTEVGGQSLCFPSHTSYSPAPAPSLRSITYSTCPCFELQHLCLSSCCHRTHWKQASPCGQLRSMNSLKVLSSSQPAWTLLSKGEGWKVQIKAKDWNTAHLALCVCGVSAAKSHEQSARSQTRRKVNNKSHLPACCSRTHFLF